MLHHVDPFSPSRVEPHSAVSGVPCPRKTVPCLHGVQNLWHVTTKSMTRLFTLCTCLCPHKRSFAGACRVFCTQRGNSPSSKCTLGRGVQPRRSLHPTPGPTLSFCPGVHAKALLLWKVCPSRTSEFELHRLFTQNLWPPHSSSPWSREVFFLCEPDMHSLHPSLFSSLFFPCGKPYLPSKAPPFFSPPIHFLHLAPTTLSLSKCGDPSPSPQINFLGVPSDLTSIQLYIRDEASPGPSSFFTILTLPPHSWRI